MKFSKIASAAAAIAAAGMMSAVASAGCLVPAKNPTPALSSDAAMWLIQLYNEGNEAENKPATNRDMDYSKVAKLAITISVVDDEYREMFSGQVGGGIILSINGGDIKQDDKDMWDKYNWPSKQFWGVDDPDLELTAAADKDVVGTKVGDYTYKFTTPAFENPLANGDASTIGCMQVGFQEWGSEMFATITVDKLEVLDANDNVLMTFDGDGNEVAGSSAPADNGDASAPADNSGASTNVDTGVESLAVVAGVAALAAGVVVLSRKRK